MREILFKAKRIDNGEWVEGYVVRYGYVGKEKYCIIPSYASDLYAFKIDLNTLCQYTGLTDKNGNKIWENDVVVEYSEYIKKGSLATVRYGEFNCSCCDGVYGWTFYMGDIREYKSYEVIGNIFDNPEVIGGADNG